MESWISTDSHPEFSLSNLPYGVFKTGSDSTPRIGVAIGPYVLDLKTLAVKQPQVFAALEFDSTILEQTTLNRYAGLGREVHHKVRKLLQEILGLDTGLGHVLRDNVELRKLALVPLSEVQMLLPMDIGDYSDFFTSPYHARNVGLHSIYLIELELLIIMPSMVGIVHGNRQARDSTSCQFLEDPTWISRTCLVHRGVWDAHPPSERALLAGRSANIWPMPETGF